MSPASPDIPPGAPLAAGGFVGALVVAPDGCGGTLCVGEVCEVYLTPDRSRLHGFVVFRPANVLGGGELFWLAEADIACLVRDEVRVGGADALRELDYARRATGQPDRLEMLGGTFLIDAGSRRVLVGEGGATLFAKLNSL